MAPKDILTKNFLQREYVNKKKSVAVIARENNIKSMNSVSQALIRHNISRESVRAIKKVTKEFLIEQYINQNKSQKEIAKMIGIQTRASIKTYLKKYNIPLRKRTISESFINGNIKRRKHEEIGGKYWSGVKSGAKQRKLDFDITIEYAWNLYLKQNQKCAITGVDIQFRQVLGNNARTQTASLDRIDSSKGYIKGNVQWVHKIINVMKYNLLQIDFIEWCKKVVENN